MARLFDDATLQYLKVATPVVTAPPFTMSCFFNSDGGTATEVLMCVGSSQTKYWLFYLHGAGDNEVAFQSYNAGAGTAVTTTFFNTNTWHHALCIEYASDSRAVWLDNGGEGTDNTSILPNLLVATTIGCTLYDGVPKSGYMSGRIAHAAIWSVALSAGERAALTGGWSPLLVRPQSLVAYWPLGGFHGEHDRDIVGGYDMTPYPAAPNAPTWGDSPGIIYPTGALANALLIGGGAAPPAATVGRLVDGGLVDAGLVGGRLVA